MLSNRTGAAPKLRHKGRDVPVIRILSRRVIRPECIETFETLAAELVRCSRAEPGCLDYTLSRSLEDPRVHIFLECWADSAAIDAHRTTEHFRRIVPQFAALTEERSPVERLTDLEV